MTENELLKQLKINLCDIKKCDNLSYYEIINVYRLCQKCADKFANSRKPNMNAVKWIKEQNDKD